MEGMKIHDEKIASGLPTYEASIATGQLTEEAEAFLTEVARLCAAMHFRLTTATTGRERSKAWTLCRRAIRQDPTPPKNPSVARMKVDAPYLIECLAYACCEQRIRRIVRRRAVTVADVFDRLLPETAAMMTPAMVAEVLERLTTVRAPLNNPEARAVDDVWRVFTKVGSASASLGETLEDRRWAASQVRIYNSCGLGVVSVEPGTGAHNATVTVRTRTGRRLVIADRGITGDGRTVAGGNGLLQEMRFGRASAASTIRHALARLIFEDEQDLHGGPEAQLISTPRVDDSGAVTFSVTVSGHSPRLRITAAGEVLETVHDTHPQIGEAFLAAACAEAGVDPAAGREFVFIAAREIRTDPDVALLLKPAPGTA